MANEFYTLIVVPHAKARFRKFQVSVRLTRWVLAASGSWPWSWWASSSTTPGSRSRSPRCGGCGREPGPRRPRRGPTRRTPGSSRPRSCSSRASSRSSASWPASSRACPTPRSAAWAASPGARRRRPRWTSPRPSRASTTTVSSLSEKSTRLEAFFKDQQRAPGLHPVDLAAARLPLGGLRQPAGPLHRAARLPPRHRHLGPARHARSHAPADGVVVFCGAQARLRQRPGDRPRLRGRDPLRAPRRLQRPARAARASAAT